MIHKILYILLLIIFSTLFIGETSYAQTFSNLDKKEHVLLAADNPFKEPTIPKPDFTPGPDEAMQKDEGGVRNILIKTILPFLAISMISIVGGMSLIFLVIAGVRFATAYGTDESITKAKDQARYAVIGLVIAILAYTIVRIVSNIEFTKTEKKENKPAAYIQTETLLIS